MHTLSSYGWFVWGFLGFAHQKLRPWHMVLLKQPGIVPGGAGVVGFRVELAPLAWHLTHSGALAASVMVWLGAEADVPTQGRLGCGDLVWQAMQETAGPLL
jgi:hypothetical protein